LSQRHGRDLRVEHGVRRFTGQIEKDFNILPTGMENLEHILVIAQQFEHRGHVQPVGLGINRSCFVGVRQLDQAKVWVIGVFPHEFGVDRDKRGLGKSLAQFGKAFAVGDEWMNLHVALAITGIPDLTKCCCKVVRRAFHSFFELSEQCTPIAAQMR
jgi:hypothetical protein